VNWWRHVPHPYFPLRSAGRSSSFEKSAFQNSRPPICDFGWIGSFRLPFFFVPPSVSGVGVDLRGPFPAQPDQGIFLHLFPFHSNCKCFIRSRCVELPSFCEVLPARLKPTSPPFGRASQPPFLSAKGSLTTRRTLSFQTDGGFPAPDPPPRPRAVSVRKTASRSLSGVFQLRRPTALYNPLFLLFQSRDSTI